MNRTHGYLRIIPKDFHGYLQNIASKKNIPLKWRPAVASVTKVYKQILGPNIRVYCRGSAVGGQIYPVSDLDMMAIIPQEISPSQEQLIKKYKEIFTEQFPHIKGGIDMEVVSQKKVEESLYQQMIISSQSVRLYGRSYFVEKKKFKPGPEIIRFAKEFSSRWQESRDALVALKDSPKQAVSNLCVKLMKRILRTGFELVMDRVNEYTRDGSSCCFYFCSYYPEKKLEMERVLELCKSPSENVDEILKVWDGIGIWMCRETKSRGF